MTQARNATLDPRGLERRVAGRNQKSTTLSRGLQPAPGPRWAVADTSKPASMALERGKLAEGANWPSTTCPLYAVPRAARARRQLTTVCKGMRRQSEGQRRCAQLAGEADIALRDRTVFEHPMLRSRFLPELVRLK